MSLEGSVILEDDDPRIKDWNILGTIIREAASDVVGTPVGIRGWSGCKLTADDVTGYASFTYFLKLPDWCIYEWINLTGLSLKCHNNMLQIRGQDIVWSYYEIPLGDPELKSKLADALRKIKRKPHYEAFKMIRQELI